MVQISYDFFSVNSLHTKINSAFFPIESSTTAHFTEINSHYYTYFCSHFTRACDTLRVIISSFLPIIQANTDPWGSARAYGGVDIPREERQKKCMECAHWLCKIKVLPDNKHMGSNLTQLQNLIVEI